MPGAGESFFVKVNYVEKPDTSRGMRYLVRVNNLWDNDWNDTMDCSQAYLYDWCNSNWQAEWYSVDLRNIIGLQPGASYATWGHNATLNWCDDNLKCSWDSSYNGCAVVGGWFKINSPPTVVEVIPDAGLSGTYTDDDNGPSCSDHNPQTFRVIYNDVDGCGDMINAYFWMDDHKPEVTLLHSSVQGAVRQSQSDYNWRMYGLAYRSLGLTCPNGSTGTNCWLNYQWDLYGGVITSDHAICSPYLAGQHSTFAYYMYPSICAEGTGDTPGGWGVTYMLCDTNTNNLVVDWRVYFNKDSLGHLLNFYAHVQDRAGANSGSWKDIGDWYLDFDLPFAESRSAHVIGESANSVHVYQRASDNGVWDTGLDSVLDRGYAYSVNGVRTPTEPFFTPLVPPEELGLNGQTNWPDGGGEYDDGPHSVAAGSNVETTISAVDMACNMTVFNENETTVGQSWIQTYRGYVYGWQDYNNPIQIEGEHMSTDWLGGYSGTCNANYFGNGVPSFMDPWWCSPSYSDNNRGNWYATLYNDALGSDWLQENQDGVIPAVTDPGAINLADGRDSIIRYTGSSTLNLTGTISGRKILFVNSGTVWLTSDLIRADYNPFPDVIEMRWEDGFVEDFDSAVYRENIYDVEAEETGSFYYVVGDKDFTGPTDYFNQWVVQKRRKSDHGLEWEKLYPQGGADDYSRAKAAVRHGDSLYVCGGALYQDAWRFERWRVEDQGNLVWEYQGDPIPNGEWGKACNGIVVSGAETNPAYVYGAGNAKLSNTDHSMVVESHQAGTGTLVNRIANDPSTNPTIYWDWYNDMAIDGTTLYIAGYENYLSGNTNSDGRWVVHTRDTGTLGLTGSAVYDNAGVHDLAKSIVLSPDAVYVAGSSGGQARVERRNKNALGTVVWQHVSPTSVTYNSIDYSDGAVIVGGSADIDGDRVSIVEVFRASDGTPVASHTENAAVSGNEYYNGVDYAADTDGGYSIYAGGGNFANSGYRWHMDELEVVENRTKDGLILVGGTNANIYVRPGAAKAESGPGGTGDDVRTRFGIGQVDIVQAAIVTDGGFNVQPDNNTAGGEYDRLGIEGLAFYRTGRMRRNLLWDHAALYPAVELHHDARYIYLFRDMLGKRMFTEFECGIVYDPDVCEGW
jgi:hypothetical protein